MLSNSRQNNRRLEAVFEKLPKDRRPGRVHEGTDYDEGRALIEELNVLIHTKEVKRREAAWGPASLYPTKVPRNANQHALCAPASERIE